MRSRNQQPSRYRGERDPSRSEAQSSRYQGQPDPRDSLRGGYGSEYGRQRGGYPEHEEEQYSQQRRSGGFQDHGEGGRHDGQPRRSRYGGSSDYGRPGEEGYGGGQEGFRGQEGPRYGGYGSGDPGGAQDLGRGSYGNGNRGREGAEPRGREGGGRGWTEQLEYDEPRFGQQGGMQRGFGRGDFGSDSQWSSDDDSRSTYGGRTSNSAASQMSGDYGDYGGDLTGGMGTNYSSGEIGGRYGSSNMSRGFGGSPTGGGYSGGQSAGGYSGGQLGGGYAGQDLDRNRQGPRGYQRSDERIREFICERLTQHHDLDVHDVSVEVRDGCVTLEGTVPERRMKYQIEDAADHTWGVKDVDNRLRVGSPSAGGSQQQDLSSGQLSSGGTTGGGSTGLTGTTGSTTARSAGGPGSSSQSGPGTESGMTSPASGREARSQGKDKE